MALPQAHNLLEINIDSPVKAVRDRGEKEKGINIACLITELAQAINILQ